MASVWWGQVEALALQKWGGQEGLDKERQRRLAKRLERAQAKAGAGRCLQSDLSALPAIREPSAVFCLSTCCEIVDVSPSQNVMESNKH